MSDEERLLIRVAADVVPARQRARALAATLGFGRVQQTRIATSVSEVARNILDYAKEGTLVIRTVERVGASGIEIVAYDDGPGIADVGSALGNSYYSTSGRMGLGLPGIRRLVDEMHIDTASGVGTTVTLRIWVENVTGAA